MSTTRYLIEANLTRPFAEKLEQTDIDQLIKTIESLDGIDKVQQYLRGYDEILHIFLASSLDFSQAVQIYLERISIVLDGFDQSLLIPREKI